MEKIGALGVLVGVAADLLTNLLKTILGEDGVMSRNQKLFCKSCFRMDVHSPVKFSALIRGILLVVSLGLIIFFWPKKCICCGKVRYT